ncbi:MAG: ATP-grasp domain-containing protein [Phycisphaerae bacterium]|nr:ATP-grasp domain-containing protein [Phycisphaerae bacterium]
MRPETAPFPVKLPPRGPIRVLFSCVGRRVELIEAFRRAGQRLGRTVEAWGTDRSWIAPGMHLVDRARLTPDINDPGYIDTLVGLTRRYGIHVLVPLIDSELLQLAMARQRFAEAGCTALISSPRVVAICRDKLLAYHHLLLSAIDSPATWGAPDVLRGRRLKYPLYMKPRAGSAARGHFICRDAEAVRVMARTITDPIVQEVVRGEEFTLDAYAGFDGRPRCVVPRLRLEVRSGEVSKGVVVMDRAIRAVGRRVVESLRECVGVITIQCIRSKDGRIRVIEINPRVGGGIPLAIEAGADFPYWILRELSGRSAPIGESAVRNGMYMLRYDRSVFVRRLPTVPLSRTAGGARRATRSRAKRRRR